MSDIPELCEDDLNALEFLHQSEKIDFNKIGIKGSSQGATKIPYLLKKHPDLAYGIAVSCPASTLLESDWNYWKNRNRDQIKPKQFEEDEQKIPAKTEIIPEIQEKSETEKKAKRIGQHLESPSLTSKSSFMKNLGIKKKRKTSLVPMKTQ